MDLHIENDKINAPFLLACSFSGLIEFIGNYSRNGVVYWQFSPKDKAQTLLNQLETKKAPPIPPLDLFNAIETFWKQVAQAKGKRNTGIDYGK